MKRPAFFSHIPRFCALMTCMTLAACAGQNTDPASGGAGPVTAAPISASTAATGGGYADMNVAYDACMARCGENNPLGFLTREGCFKGCAEARRQAYQRGASLTGTGDCYAAMSEMELNRDLHIETMQLWCEQELTHLHKAAGCRDAMAAFYGALTVENVCGGTATTAYPTPATPPATGSFSPASGQGQGGTAGQSQPAAPLPKGTYTAPPVYVPAPSVSAPAATGPAVTPAPSGVATGARPYLMDTPKYQTPRAGTGRSAPAQAAPVSPRPATAKPAASSSAGASTSPKPAQHDTPEKDAPLAPLPVTRPATTPAPAPGPVPGQGQTPDLPVGQTGGQPAGQTVDQPAGNAPAKATEPTPEQATTSGTAQPQQPAQPVQSPHPAQSAQSTQPPQPEQQGAASSTMPLWSPYQPTQPEQQGQDPAAVARPPVPSMLGESYTAPPLGAVSPAPANPASPASQ